MLHAVGRYFANEPMMRLVLPLCFSLLAGCGFTPLDCSDDTVDASGFAFCEDNLTRHRPVPVTCDKLGPATTGRACTSDEHCTSNGICICGPLGGLCQPSHCRSDLDCEGSFACVQEHGVDAFACQTAEDECMTDDDCSDASCFFNDGRRRCIPFDECNDACFLN
jgi:hypothetical protein